MLDRPGPAGDRTGAGWPALIEDVPRISDLIALYLSRDGFEVAQCPDGPGGIEAVARWRPRLVILDVGLAGDLDGLEVCRRLRATSTVPVVMVTARDEEVDKVLVTRRQPVGQAAMRGS